MHAPDPSLAHADDLVRARTIRVLQAGFRIAVALLAIGLVLAALKREDLPHQLGDPGEIVRGIFQGDPGSVLGLGIVGVILTPLVATIVIAWTYKQLGDQRNATISAIVVLILLVSVSLSAL